MNYGYVNPEHLEEHSKVICDCLGYGKHGTADKLLDETAQAETLTGTLRDRTLKAGMGICQIDNGPPYYPFNDIIKRSQKHREKIITDLGVDINLLVWEALRYDHFNSKLVARLIYKPVPANIPGDMVGRAQYWKRYYNTKAGRGSVFHYLEANGFDMSKYSEDMEVKFD